MAVYYDVYYDVYYELCITVFNIACAQQIHTANSEKRN